MRLDDSKEGYEFTSREVVPETYSTKLNNPWINFGFNIIAVLILGNNISKIDDFFFVSLVIFALPIFFDTLGFLPKDLLGKVIKKGQAIALLIVLGSGFLGIFKILNIVDTMTASANIEVNNDFMVLAGLKFPVCFVWYGTIACLIFQGLYLYAVKSPAEKNIMARLNRSSV